MELITLFLAKVLGVYMLVAGLSALLYPDRARKAMAEVTKSYILPYFDGALALIFGLLVVLLHNVWEGLAASLVTLIGWLAVLEGIVMLLSPQESIASLGKKLSTPGMVRGWSIVAVVVGAYLAYVGFLM